MFKRYAETIIQILNARGTFDTDPETVVNTVLYTLAGLIQADAHAVEAPYVVSTPTAADLELIFDRALVNSPRA